MRLAILDFGGITDQNSGVPVPGFLIQTDDGHTILVDTGMPSSMAGPRETAAERSPFGPSEVPLLDHVQTVEAQLARAGLTPRDVDTVICSHFDWDHCGENRLFGHARLLVQQAHLDAARSDKRERYTRVPWDLPGLTYTPLHGDTDVAAGVRVLGTPGHAVGHQSVLVSWPDGSAVVLCVDAVSLPHYLDGTHGDAFEDPAAARTSIEKLVATARERGAPLIYGHDPVQWRTLQTAPHWYETAPVIPPVAS